jgi:hypothetical protein
MYYFIAALAFAIAAFLALFEKGTSLLTILGIIAIGLLIMALAAAFEGGPAVSWGRNRTRRVP